MPSNWVIIAAKPPKNASPNHGIIDRTHRQAFTVSDLSLNLEPRYGYYPWWPEDGDGWLHPEDVEQARQMIPSLRIFRRDGGRGPYVVLHYGQIRLRVKRTLWQEIDAVAFEMGDWVEVRSRGSQNQPRTGTIREIVWNQRARQPRYQILDAGTPIPNYFTAEDLRHVEPPMEKLNS